MLKAAPVDAPASHQVLVHVRSTGRAVIATAIDLLSFEFKRVFSCEDCNIYTQIVAIQHGTRFDITVQNASNRSMVVPGITTLPESLAADLRLASGFEEYLVCKVYLDVLDQDNKPETTTLKSMVQTRVRSISRGLISAAGPAYPKLDMDIIGEAATLIMQRHPGGKDYYLSLLPVQ